MANIQMNAIKSAALDNASEGITISDARLPDNPLIFVNKGFTAMTGYSAEEVMGKNCRFLQGSMRQQDGVKKIRHAIANKKSIRQEIINYKKDGAMFWNRLSITPVFDKDGSLTHFIGVQYDISLQKEKEALEHKLSYQAMVNEITASAENKQRKEIGEELHDNINQLLAVSKLYVAIGLRQEDQRFDMLKKTGDILSTAMVEIQKLSRNLVGPDSKETLKTSLSELVQSVKFGVKFAINLSIDEAVEKLISPGRKLLMYRVVQEQLNNIIKYAEASAVNVHIFENENSINLSIKDNGKGFDPKAVNEGIGLQNMRNRCELENGNFAVITAGGLGCEIRITLPLVS